MTTREDLYNELTAVFDRTKERAVGLVREHPERAPQLLCLELEMDAKLLALVALLVPDEVGRVLRQRVAYLRHLKEETEEALALPALQ